MATCVDVAGAEYPAQSDENAITPMQGVSLVPAMQGESIVQDLSAFPADGTTLVVTGDGGTITIGHEIRKMQLVSDNRAVEYEHVGRPEGMTRGPGLPNSRNRPSAVQLTGVIWTDLSIAMSEFPPRAI